LDLTFEGHTVRFVGTPEKPEWIAADICKVLEIANPHSSLALLDDDEKGIHSMDTLRGKQRLVTVYESGLYSILFTSTKPAAKRFRKWVTGEVLPSIRKHGIYPPPETFAYKLTLKPYTARIVWGFQIRKNIPEGHWCVFLEGAEILMHMEMLLGSVDLEMKQFDLLDGSIGKCWANYRKDKEWAVDRVMYEYTFPAPDPRGRILAWAYHLEELQHFKHWLHSEYLTVNMPDYIKTKYKAKEFQRMLPVFAEMGVMLPNRDTRQRLKDKKV
jgi:prophage antirepressor-like protein